MRTLYFVKVILNATYEKEGKLYHSTKWYLVCGNNVQAIMPYGYLSKDTNRLTFPQNNLRFLPHYEMFEDDFRIWLDGGDLIAKEVE